ncbi:SMC domain protein [Dolichospermum planctonicum]|uniref:SMC domain protein n=2 Tax=Dolichospermum planctonicum TaxID=136072 RepID=A0A480AEB3_9CYAN|nr:SMC domain protein [Dolichospermum planctonicum]
MYIKKLQVFNYKSYYDSGEMEFSPGVNIIVGRNNAGKTSLLEVLTLDFEDHPHRSIKTLPNKSSRLEEKSRIEIIWDIEKEELLSFMKQMSPDLGIPAPKLDENYIEMLSLDYQNSEDSPEEYKIKYGKYLYGCLLRDLSEFKTFLENSDSIDISLCIYRNINLNHTSLQKLLNFESYSYDYNEDFNGRFYKIFFDNNEMIIEDFYHDDCEESKGTINESIGKKLFDTFVSRIYKFKAERLNIGTYKLNIQRTEVITKSELKPDASNLAEVLFRLNSENRGMFDYFTELVSNILPEIESITVALRDNSDLEILVWNKDSIKHRRGDLALPLSSCGSGVSQVLAIVYILVSSIHEPRTIIIDEPQSFLHPGAARKLIETIKQFPQHQYFIATHSPEIITAANPSNIIKLQYENCQTTALRIDTKDIESQNEILDELGIRLSDVFGADNILWVEGPTEEKCFPLILEELAKIPLRGLKILSVNSTDALLDGKHSDLVAEVYKKLTTGASLFPPAIGFIFDRENKTEAKIKELEKRNFTFLNLPMYENYLLNAEAISAIINQKAKWLETPKFKNIWILLSRKKAIYFQVSKKKTFLMIIGC